MSKTNGDSYELMPIDRAILEALPDEGQMLGYTPIALNVKTICQRPEFKNENGQVIAGRLRSLLFYGFVTTQRVLPVQKGLGWQRTAKGKAAIEKQKVVSK